jgi:hypothetical protein
MDGTSLTFEIEQETRVRIQPPAAAKKTNIWLWLGLLGLSGLVLIGLAGAFVIYKYKTAGDNAQANNSNKKASPTQTAKPKSSISNTTTNSPPSNIVSTPKVDKSTSDEDSDDVTPIDWTTSASAFKNDVGMVYKFECPADGVESSVWGSDIYTQDSSICTAAVHAGVITLAEGGTVTLEFRPGRLTYGSTLRNGIKSSTYGEYAHSFVVR